MKFPPVVTLLCLDVSDVRQRTALFASVEQSLPHGH